MNSKGFAVSPFFIVALILLAVLIAIHLMSIDSSKAKSIAEEGKLNKDILNLEEPKSSLKTLTLLSAHQAAYDAGQEGIPAEGALINKLREDIAADLANFNSYENLAVTGTFTVEIEPGTEEERREGFMVSVAGKNIQSGGSDMSSALGAEKFTGARIFLLRDLSTGLEAEFKGSLADQLENCLIPEISCGGSPTSCWGDKMKLSAAAHGDENDPCESSYPKPEAWTTWMEDPKKVADVLNRAVIHIERKASNGEYFSYITTEDCAIKLETDEIKTSVRREATGFCDCGHYVCVDRPEEDEDCGDDNCCEWDWVCDDYDSHVTLTITGTIKINASIVDYSTLHEESKEKFEVCVNHPLILEDGETAPLEFKKDFPVDYRIVVKYTTDRSIGDFNKNPGPFHYSTPSYEFTNLEYTTDSKVCESGSSFEVDCEVKGGGDDGGGGEEDDDGGDGEGEDDGEGDDIAGWECDDGKWKPLVVDRTNEYHGGSENGCGGTVTASCGVSDCVACGGWCAKPGQVYAPQSLCLNGKWDLCSPGGPHTQSGWECNSGLWRSITVRRTNEYYDGSENGCGGTVTASCGVSDCVACGGWCAKSGQVYAPQSLCLNGKWDLCSPGDHYII